MNKPLGQKAYGSIPHLPGSKRGPKDKGLSPEQASILTNKTRIGDLIIVQEKIDGSNVSIAKINGLIVPLVRAGYRAESSPYEQHHLFANWVMKDYSRWLALLEDGERLCGEWCAFAHGTKYDLSSAEPFWVFDLMRGHDRALLDECESRLEKKVQWVPVIHRSESPFSISDALKVNGDCGATGCGLEQPEGAVWRVERKGRVEFLGKYVRPDFVPGKYFDDNYWNWQAA